MKGDTKPRSKPEPLLRCAACGCTKHRARPCGVCAVLARVLNPDVLWRWQ